MGYASGVRAPGDQSGVSVKRALKPGEFRTRSLIEILATTYWPRDGLKEAFEFAPIAWTAVLLLGQRR
jgi:hypothetical protein